jgi:hypothetical protein
MFCSKLFYIFGGLLSLTSITGLITTLVYYYHKYEELECGNLRTGVVVGIIALVGQILSILLYLITCCSSTFKKFLIGLFSLNVIGSFIYNLYLNQDITNNCKEYYKEKDIWEYYNYFMVTLFVNSILIIGVFIAKCYISKD